jgi:predicted TIM-barrel fold metal-dependent hydrolase
MKTTFDKIASKICDFHAHYGRFREDIYNPDQIVTYYETLGIDKVGIMPTGIAGEVDFDNDLKILKAMSSRRFVPYLWVTPEMFDLSPDLSMFNELKYRAIKIHAYAHKDWHEMPDKIRGVIEVAYAKNVPLMFHTGGWRGSNAIQYYKFCREYPEVTFILAHGKPISQTLTVLKGAKNAYTDISFMSNESIKLICDAGLSNRILFGTDFPIMKTFWPEINLLDWYRNNVIELIEKFGEKDFMIWANENFYKLIFRS